MIQAVISRLVKDRGFGFATSITSSNESGELFFFHMSALDPRTGAKFDNLVEGTKVEFLREEAPKGPRAAPRSMRIIDHN